MGESRSIRIVIDNYCAARRILETVERANKLRCTLNVLKTAAYRPRAETIAITRGIRSDDASEDDAFKLNIFSGFLPRAASFCSHLTCASYGVPCVSYRTHLITPRARRYAVNTSQLRLSISRGYRILTSRASRVYANDQRPNAINYFYMEITGEDQRLLS